MFEGTELEKKLGDYGTASVDVTPELKVKVALSVEIDLIAEAKKLADKTKTPYDNTALEWLEKITRAAQTPT